DECVRDGDRGYHEGEEDDQSGDLRGEAGKRIEAEKVVGGDSNGYLEIAPDADDFGWVERGAAGRRHSGVAEALDDVGDPHLPGEQDREPEGQEEELAEKLALHVVHALPLVQRP